MIKKTTDWQWWFKPFSVQQGKWREDTGWHMFHFGIVKFKEFLPEGYSFGPENYHGFIIRFMWWFPIDKA